MLFPIWPFGENVNIQSSLKVKLSWAAVIGTVIPSVAASGREGRRPLEAMGLKEV